jgi:hypothetical protein
MSSTYSPLKIELIGTGEQVATWGQTTNTNLGTTIEQAIGGKADVTMSSTSITLTLTNTNALQDARALYLNLTGTPGGAATLNVPAVQKAYIVKNGTTGGFAVTVKVTGQTGISVPNGATMHLYNNGTDVVNAITNLPAGATIGGSPIGSGAGSVTSVSGTGTVSGITLSGTVTSSGSLTLGGSLSNVDLSTQVTGTLPTNRGGTGQTVTQYCNLLTNVSGTLPFLNGGTGFNTINQGEIIYGSASNVLAKLAKNTTATRYLSNTGSSNNPEWAQVNVANGVTGVLPIANGGTGGTIVTFGFKNRIMNGDMVIDQHNNGASSSGNDVYPIDRFIMRSNIDGTITAQRSTVAPPGFSNSLLFTVSSQDTSIGSTQFFNFRQRIEGNNVVDFSLGTASAGPIAVSFWVRSSVTGTYGLALTNSADSRLYPTSFTINVADTWEYKTVTLTGDTGGTWLGGTSIGLQVIFSLALGSSFVGSINAWTTSTIYGPSGAVNFAQTNGSTFYITGLQVERNTAATSFDYRPSATEVLLCQRYFFKATDYSLGYTYANNLSYLSSVRFPTTMRTAPSLVSGAAFTVQSGSAGTPALIGVTGGQTTVDQAPIYNLDTNWTSAVAVSLTAGFNAEFSF